MRNDSCFKANCHIEGFERYKYSKEYSEWYRPDLVLEKIQDKEKDSDSKTIIIAEDSTTGDRKSHIAEIIQFITHIKNDGGNKKYYYMLFIPQKDGSEAPKVEIERKRIKYYYEEMAPDDVKNRVEGIYVIDENVVNIEKLTLDVLENWRVI